MNNQHVFALLQGGEIVILDFDDNEECEENVNIENYAEENVPRMVNDQFKQHFRMYRETFEHIYVYLARLCISVRRPEIAIEKQLMVTLWYLANAETFRYYYSYFT